MNKKINVPDIPLCINIIRLQSYLLAPDEVVLFDWFVVKQTSFKYKEFHYSQARIEEETRIKRTRQNVIVSKFKELGFLSSQVRENKETRGRVNYFKVNFEVLADKDVLSEIINENEAIFKNFMQYMKYLSSEQRKSLKSKKDDSFDKERAEHIYKLLNETYEKRRIMYNDGDLTEKKPQRAKSKTQLQRNKPIEKKLIRLSQSYNNNAICHAFTAYTDSVFKGEKFPENFMNYFLSYDDTTDSFKVFEYYLNYFNLHYGYDNT
ncbi:hypothetical protein [Coprobacter secundus]|uniref:Uncharacterized protein n=1 Tax=Coprobacter secundus subsp. similis TaxID=2751153 RepID=A0A7G1HYV0_9BACT|nr:hypothetical protein [Coprobacter secundus]BCI64889.1 hypothetical protein Cop2CBH44_32420 [Coprobacter secundus subsp. similis]